MLLTEILAMNAHQKVFWFLVIINFIGLLLGIYDLIFHPKEVEMDLGSNFSKKLIWNILAKIGLVLIWIIGLCIEIIFWIIIFDFLWVNTRISKFFN